MYRVYCLAFLGCLLAACSGSERLTENDAAKLEPRLRPLIVGRTPGTFFPDSSVRSDGTTEYALIVRCSSLDDLRSADINVTSAVGDLMTVRVSVAELRRLLKIPSVRSVEGGSRSWTQ